MWRGRVDALRTERRHLLQRGKIACSFDELTTDTPRNRYVRAALGHLHRMVSDNELRRRAASPLPRWRGRELAPAVPATPSGMAAGPGFLLADRIPRTV